MESKLLDYFTIDEVASKSGMTSEQVLRLGMSGSIILSILEHKPKNYEEIDDYIDEKGLHVVRTRRNETTTLIGNPRPGLQIQYISTEDVINIVANDKERKNTLVRGLYETRELDPKKGKWMLNSPLSLSRDDLVVKAEEWERFQRGDGKRLAAYLPLKAPEKVTVSWLVHNISIKAWISAVALAATIFAAGVYFSETGIYKEIKNKFTVENSSSKSL